MRVVGLPNEIDRLLFPQACNYVLPMLTTQSNVIDTGDKRFPRRKRFIILAGNQIIDSRLLGTCRVRSSATASASTPKIKTPKIPTVSIRCGKSPYSLARLTLRPGIAALARRTDRGGGTPDLKSLA
jgi:hypothetical protein